MEQSKTVDPFQTGRCLSNFEAFEAFNQPNNEINRMNGNENKSLLDLAKEYAETFKYFESRASLDAARSRLADIEINDINHSKLTEEEIATILNLCPSTIEEACLFVPALSSLPVEELTSLLVDLKHFLE